jgi:chromosome segregation ATPase
VKEIKQHTSAINHIIHEGDFVYTASDDFSILKWNAQQFQKVRIFSGHQASVKTLCLQRVVEQSANTEDILISTSNGDKTIKFWGCGSGRLIGTIALKEHKQSDVEITDMCVQNNYLWVGAKDGLVYIWNTKTLSLEKKLQVHSSAVTCLSSLGSEIWSTSDDKTICIWNSQTFQLLNRIPTSHKDSVSRIKKVSRADTFRIWTVDSYSVRMWDEQCAFGFDGYYFYDENNSLNSSFTSNHGGSPGNTSSYGSPPPATLNDTIRRLTQTNKGLTDKVIELEDRLKLSASKKIDFSDEEFNNNQIQIELQNCKTERDNLQQRVDELSTKLRNFEAISVSPDVLNKAYDVIDIQKVNHAQLQQEKQQLQASVETLQRMLEEKNRLWSNEEFLNSTHPVKNISTPYFSEEERATATLLDSMVSNFFIMRNNLANEIASLKRENEALRSTDRSDIVDRLSGQQETFLAKINGLEATNRELTSRLKDYNEIESKYLDLELQNKEFKQSIQELTLAKSEMFNGHTKVTKQLELDVHQLEREKKDFQLLMDQLSDIMTQTLCTIPGTENILASDLQLLSRHLHSTVQQYSRSSQTKIIELQNENEELIQLINDIRQPLLSLHSRYTSFKEYQSSSLKTIVSEIYTSIENMAIQLSSQIEETERSSQIGQMNYQSRIEVLERNIADLRQEKLNLEEDRNRSIQLNETSLSRYQKEILSLQSSQNDLTAQIDQAKSALVHISTTISNNSKAVSVSTDLHTMLQELEDILQSKLSNLSSEIRRLELVNRKTNEELETNFGDVTGISHRAEELEILNSGLQKQLEYMKNKLVDSTKNNQNIVTNLEELKTDFQEKEAENAKLKKQHSLAIRQLEMKVDDLETEVNRSCNSLLNTWSIVSEHTISEEDKKSVHALSANLHLEVQKTLKNLIQKIEDREYEIKDFKRKVQELQEELVVSETKHENTKVDIENKYKRRVASLESHNQELRHELEQAEESISSTSRMHSQNYQSWKEQKKEYTSLQENNILLSSKVEELTEELNKSRQLVDDISSRLFNRATHRVFETNTLYAALESLRVKLEKYKDTTDRELGDLRELTMNQATEISDTQKTIAEFKELSSRSVTDTTDNTKKLLEKQHSYEKRISELKLSNSEYERINKMSEEIISTLEATNADLDIAVSELQDQINSSINVLSKIVATKTTQESLFDISVRVVEHYSTNSPSSESSQVPKLEQIIKEKSEQIDEAKRLLSDLLKRFTDLRTSSTILQSASLLDMIHKFAKSMTDRDMKAQETAVQLERMLESQVDESKQIKDALLDTAFMLSEELAASLKNEDVVLVAVAVQNLIIEKLTDLHNTKVSLAKEESNRSQIEDQLKGVSDESDLLLKVLSDEWSQKLDQLIEIVEIDNFTVTMSAAENPLSFNDIPLLKDRTVEERFKIVRDILTDKDDRIRKLKKEIEQLHSCMDGVSSVLKRQCDECNENKSSEGPHFAREIYSDEEWQLMTEILEDIELNRQILEGKRDTNRSFDEDSTNEVSKIKYYTLKLRVSETCLALINMKKACDELVGQIEYISVNSSLGTGLNTFTGLLFRSKGAVEEEIKNLRMENEQLLERIQEHESLRVQYNESLVVVRSIARTVDPSLVGYSDEPEVQSPDYSALHTILERSQEEDELTGRLSKPKVESLNNLLEQLQILVKKNSERSRKEKRMLEDQLDEQLQINNELNVQLEATRSALADAENSARVESPTINHQSDLDVKNQQIHALNKTRVKLEITIKQLKGRIQMLEKSDNKKSSKHNSSNSLRSSFNNSSIDTSTDSLLKSYVQELKSQLREKDNEIQFYSNQLAEGLGAQQLTEIRNAMHSLNSKIDKLIKSVKSYLDTNEAKAFSRLFSDVQDLSARILLEINRVGH